MFLMTTLLSLFQALRFDFELSVDFDDAVLARELFERRERD